MNLYTFEPRHQNTPQRETQFDLCSDKMKAKYPNYTLDKDCKVVPKSFSPVQNFEKLKELLLSKNLRLDEAWSKDGELHFLDAKFDMTGNQVAF